jgi:hypothetical protein
MVEGLECDHHFSLLNNWQRGSFSDAAGIGGFVAVAGLETNDRWRERLAGRGTRDHRSHPVFFKVSSSGP